MDASMAPASSYFGTGVFWLYIVFALFFALTVIMTILQLPGQKVRHDDQIHRTTILFSTLAAISFATLSFNMLHVLVQSYNEWSASYLTSRLTSNENLLTRIWTWSTTRPLFRDFGEAIVADSARYLWALSALLVTMSVCTYMGMEGKRRQIPRLWAFFALSQILPISFAQNVFYIALVRQSASTIAIDIRPVLSTVVLLAYSLGLSVAPRAAETKALIPLILAARMLLFAQLLLVKTGTGIQDAAIVRRIQRPVGIIGVLLTLRQAYLALQTNSIQGIGKAIVSHPAVSALGFDFILSVLSFLAWIYVSPILDRSYSKKRA